MLYIYADLFANFQCRMCGECCRNDWQVTVDQACYQRNAALFGRTGRSEEFQQAFLPVPADRAGFGEYAMIAKQAQAQGQCWFLQANQLCRLQREAGHDHLDAVCRTFPRYPMDTARGVELTLSFSCPAVLELAGAAAIEFIRSEARPSLIYSEEYVTHVYPQQHRPSQPLHYYFELERHFIDILQWRDWPLADRVAMIIATIDKLCAAAGDVGSAISRLAADNYDRLAGASVSRSDQLLENFLVNIMFKKILYDHGLQRGGSVLRFIWTRLSEAAANSPQWEAVCNAVQTLEFEFSHHRSRFYRNSL